MAPTIDEEIKYIISDLEELLFREEELSRDENLRVMYSYDWINSKIGVEKNWNLFNQEQQTILAQKYAEVKTIAQKLKLPWPKVLI